MNHHSRIDYRVLPAAALAGELRVPGDKSISHRALMLGAIATGTTHINGFLNGEDTLATMAALRQLGVGIEQPGADAVVVHGLGLHGLKAPQQPLNLGNSGTSVRLLAGLLCGQRFDSELQGDDSLSRRPMERVIAPLRQMGGELGCSKAGTLPIQIHGGRRLQGISYEMPVASAQLKSALLLAGLYAQGWTCIQEPAVTRDHTERMLAYFGCPLEKKGDQICIESRQPVGRQVEVPGDISSAAFFMVAASIVPGSEIRLTNVGLNPTRHAVVEILRAMGAAIEIENERVRSGEPLGDLHIKYSNLRGITIPTHLVPIAIDEFPAILVAAACAKGRTVLSGAAELRVKESDRIQAMYSGLQAMGITAEAQQDGMVIEGGRLAGGAVESYGDHRIAMAFTVAGLAAAAVTEIRDCINVNTSFPNFVQSVRAIGGELVVEQGGDG